MARILVFSPDPNEAQKYRALIEKALPKTSVAHAATSEEAAPLIADAEILFGWKFPEGLLRQAKSVKWLHKVSAGVEDIVSDPGRPASMRLTRSDGLVIAPRMVEYVLCAIYAATQNFMRAFRQKEDRRWENYMVGRASGKTVGVAGLGDIGMALCRALNANGMRVVGWRRSKGAPPAGIDRVYSGRAELDDFVSTCDFVVSVLPATEETRDVFGASVFAAMRPDCVFINIGRGISVDEDALVQAVARKQIAGAVLDVFKQEPLPVESPLWSAENIVITPHVSGPIVPEDVVPLFVENYHLYVTGKRLLKEVDFARGY